MDFMELCMIRQSCRSFDDRPVPHEMLMRIAEAARLAPSGCNSQPWKFYFVESEEKVAVLREAAQQLGFNGFLDKAKAFAVVVETYAQLAPSLLKIVDSQTFAEMDIGAATAYISLAASDLGVGNCQIGFFDRATVAETLKIDKSLRIRSLIAFGMPADGSIKTKGRKPMDEVAEFV